MGHGIVYRHTDVLRLAMAGGGARGTKYEENIKNRNNRQFFFNRCPGASLPFRAKTKGYNEATAHKLVEDSNTTMVLA